MMVAMLQKLSLRSQQRIYMIESGLLEWLINHLHDKCRIINLYQLEYATALLMNLSLHRLAQARASKVASLLVSTLLILFSLDHASVSKAARVFSKMYKEKQHFVYRLLVTTVHQRSAKQLSQSSRDQ